MGPGFNLDVAASNESHKVRTALALLRLVGRLDHVEDRDWAEEVPRDRAREGAELLESRDEQVIVGERGLCVAKLAFELFEEVARQRHVWPGLEGGSPGPPSVTCHDPA
jgi:hypothetical protein